MGWIMAADPAAVALAVIDMAQAERFTEIEAHFAPPLREGKRWPY